MHPDPQKNRKDRQPPSEQLGVKEARTSPVRSSFNRAQELCESRDGRPGLPVLNKPDGFCGHKVTLNSKLFQRLCGTKSQRLSIEPAVET